MPPNIVNKRSASSVYPEAALTFVKAVPLFSPLLQEPRGVGDAAHLQFLRNPAHRHGGLASQAGGDLNLAFIAFVHRAQI
jgi:hypothetical protein